jgi:hypothetical protein
MFRYKINCGYATEREEHGVEFASLRVAVKCPETCDPILV